MLLCIYSCVFFYNSETLESVIPWDINFDSKERVYAEFEISFVTSNPNSAYPYYLNIGSDLTIISIFCSIAFGSHGTVLFVYLFLSLIPT